MSEENFKDAIVKVRNLSFYISLSIALITFMRYFSCFPIIFDVY